MEKRIASRDVYAEKSLPCVKRLLTLLDRNRHSPTFGCFHRDYWLYKTSDFPDAVRQFGVHSLALVYRHDFPGNIYRNNPLVGEWAAAALLFWADIQHGDGSFDEFYPFERGWVGPTAFTTYASVEAFNLLEEEIRGRDRDKILDAIKKAARFISRGGTEKDFLANHHAMAALSLWKSFELLGDQKLKEGYEKAWHTFLDYHNPREGWSREYDGADPGYLSATVSFLAKIYRSNPDPDLLGVLKQSVEFCSYFVYPDGSYAGALGSRNTQHFYPHGFEILAGEIPAAASAAEACLAALEKDRLVPPGIMSDRYVFYRVPELLLSYLDYGGRPPSIPPLPFETQELDRKFPESGVHAGSGGGFYTVSNLARGGVVKVFDSTAGRLVMNDCGLVGKLSDGRVVTSQCIGADYKINFGDKRWEVSGSLYEVPSHKLMSLSKNIIFRLALLLMGWNPKLSHILKGKIRSMLILGGKKVPVSFRRTYVQRGDAGTVSSEIFLKDANIKFSGLSAGGEFFVRYVPQSRFFQEHELADFARHLSEDELAELNRKKTARITCSVFRGKKHSWSVE